MVKHLHKSSILDAFILSGFLGSGKTELLNQIIRQNSDKNIVVIENEIAEFGIDGKVSASGNVKVIEINDGPISSVNRGCFRKVLKKVLMKIKPDLLVVEASGAANISNVYFALSEVSLSLGIRIKTYGLTVIDGERFSKATKLSSYTLGHLNQASLVLLNKSDLITKKEKDKLFRNLTMLNSNVIYSTKCAIDIANSLKDRPTLESLCKNTYNNNNNNKSQVKNDSKAKSNRFNFGSNYLLWKIKNNLGISSCGSKKLVGVEKHNDLNAYVFESYGLISKKCIKRFFTKHKFPRAKGFVYLLDKKLYYFNVISDRFYIEQAPVQKKKNLRLNRIVLIGRGVYSKRSVLANSLKSCLKISFYDNLMNLYLKLRNQQRMPDRIVYSE